MNPPLRPVILVQLCDFQRWNQHLSMVLHCTYLGRCVSGLSVNARRSVASSSISISSHWVPPTTSLENVSGLCGQTEFCPHLLQLTCFTMRDVILEGPVREMTCEPFEL